VKMAVEIERKFLVVNDLWRRHVISSSDIKQAYLSNQVNVTVRIRIYHDKAILTIKGPTRGISRDEFEYAVPVDDAQKMLDLRQTGVVIEKTRHKIKCGEHIWDLDIFYGENEGLKMAEVELESESEEFQMPEWAGPEVTGDRRYANSNLVEEPYCNWHDR
jgi:adenylate cyclase